MIIQDGSREFSGAEQSVGVEQGMALGADLVKAVPPSERPFRQYVLLMGFGVATGFAANFFLGGAPGIGLNLFLVMLVFYTGWFTLARHRPVPLWRKLCGAAGLGFFAATAFRASDVIYTVNLLLAIGFTSVACTAGYGSRMKSLVATMVDQVQVGFNLIFGSVMVVLEAPWNRMRRGTGQNPLVLRIGTGVFIALPFLLVFGALFSNAEVRFGNLFEQLFTILNSLLFHNFWITFWATIFAMGLLRGAFFSRSVLGERESLGESPVKLGIVESATVLALLNAMFLVFVITQLPYLFGGQDRINITPNLAWSEYARSGFFELAWVAGLLIPTLMLFMNLTRTETNGQLRLLRGLCGGLTILAGIVIMSALQRMLLYTHNFGLTEMRVFVSTFIVMLAVILILLNVLNLTGRNHWFLPSALAVGVVFSVGIQIPNVQGLVARDIIERHLENRESDVDYLRSLSADAIPAIESSGLPVASKTAIIDDILSHARSSDVPISWLYRPLSVVRAVGR